MMIFHNSPRSVVPLAIFNPTTVIKVMMMWAVMITMMMNTDGVSLSYRCQYCLKESKSCYTSWKYFPSSPVLLLPCFPTFSLLYFFVAFNQKQKIKYIFHLFVCIKIFIKSQLNCWNQKNVIIEPESFTSVKSSEKSEQESWRKNPSHSVVLSSVSFVALCGSTLTFSVWLLRRFNKKERKTNLDLKQKVTKGTKAGKILVTPHNPPESWREGSNKRVFWHPSTVFYLNLH